jgi:uncharacterized protein (UPF0335 family)
MSDTEFDDVMGKSESMGGNAREMLKNTVEKIERLESEKAEMVADIREVYAEAKTRGFDTKILRKAIAVRKIEAAERAEQNALLDLYLDALEGF